MKVQKECEDKMNIMMNLKLQEIFGHLKQMGAPLPDDSFVHDVGTPKHNLARSSCQSVDRQENFSNLKIPTLCRLWVIHSDKGKVIVARGTVFPSSSQGNNSIHRKPIAPHNVRVSVDDIVGEFQLTHLPVPCDEHETVGDAAGSFVQWPKNLVTLGQDPISVEKKKGHEMNGKKVGHIPKKVESKGSETPIKKNKVFHEDDIYSTENCQSLHFLLNNLPSSHKDNVFKFEQNEEDPIYVTREDVYEFLRMSWINIPILEIFSKYIGKLCNELNDDSFAFMLPSKLALPYKHQYRHLVDVSQYMSDFLIKYKKKGYILAPYIQDDHWMLLLLCLHKAVIYVFDPLKKERKIHLKSPARSAYEIYLPSGGRKNNRKDFLWYHTEVKCPQQKGGTECGFFVMRYMYDIVMLSQKDRKMNWKLGLSTRSYTKRDINEMRELWASYFTDECL